jgi:hypothetical protein
MSAFLLLPCSVKVPIPYRLLVLCWGLNPQTLRTVANAALSQMVTERSQSNIITNYVSDAKSESAYSYGEASYAFGVS